MSELILLKIHKYVDLGDPFVKIIIKHPYFSSWVSDGLGITHAPLYGLAQARARTTVMV